MKNICNIKAKVILTALNCTDRVLKVNFGMTLAMTLVS